MKALMIAIASVIAGVLIVYVHPLAPLVLLAGMGVGAVLFSSPYCMLLGFLMVLFLRPAEFFPALSVLQLGKIFSLGALGSWLASKAIRQDLSFVPTRQHLFVFGLAVWVWLSSIFGTDRTASLATYTDVFVKILILYVLISHLLDTPERFVGYQLVMGSVVASLGGYALVTKALGMASIEGSRAALVGYLGDPNDLAMVLLMGAVFAIQGVSASRGKQRAFFVVIAIFTVGGILATQSRGGLLGLMGGSYFVMRDHIKSRVVIGAGLAVALVGALVLGGVTDRASGGSPQHGEGQIDESAQGRLDAWGAGARMVRSNPVFGVGFSRFADNYERYVSNPVIWGKHETHNAYIKCASETGIPGVGFFLAMIGWALWGAWCVRQQLETAPATWANVCFRGLFPSMVAVLITAFFLSACWSWFIYMLVAQSTAMQWIVEQREVAS